jgi:hypothetical protein
VPNRAVGSADCTQYYKKFFSSLGLPETNFIASNARKFPIVVIKCLQSLGESFHSLLLVCQCCKMLLQVVSRGPAVHEELNTL